MATVNDVADYILHEAHEAGELVTNLKLQKLVYYAQAWSLAIRDRRLFNAHIEAWVHGPVAPALYRRFKDHGWSPILDDVERPDLTGPERKLLDEVLNVYLGFSAWDLERMTHAEDPWREARGDLEPAAHSNARISDESMKAYYWARAKADEAEDTE